MYKLESIKGILCETCVEQITKIYLIEIPGNERLQCLSCELVIAQLLDKVRNTIKIPEWVFSEILEAYIKLEIIKLVHYNGPLCSQYLLKDFTIIENAIKWTEEFNRKFSTSCPYKIEELEKEKMFIIHIPYNKEQEAKTKEEISIIKKVLH